MAIANFSDIDVIQLIQTEYPVNVLYPHDDKAGLEINIMFIISTVTWLVINMISAAQMNMASNQPEMGRRNERT